MQEFTVPSGLEVVDVGGGFFNHGERYYLRPDQRALLDQEAATAPEENNSTSGKSIIDRFLDIFR
jgi:hypothetical protein